ncbi:MAG: RdgB/HAM1 family non-canonical purine NTP pyrophosphatase [Acidobacteriaceae bacterium]|nr:RdgB/HAM1 family non-canonical purine NTP pyrophosphatase [Acidobacteriaceae bacterium]MBV9499297.1 RdgB/HAM1 family non-canonical purine NTP pyrophosphatase [Acidobacteriaceae bacterium]
MLLYACSTNPGKLREFALAVDQCGAGDLQLEPLPNLRRINPPEETGTSFEDNAALKAVYYSRLTSELVFADDSGLEVKALNGAPGVLSARFAGPGADDEANNALLLENLRDAPDRQARFVCVIAVAREGSALTTFRGEVEGEILDAPHGDGGFGYDPLFFYSAFGRTLAEVTAELKFSVSHRGKALRAMIRWLTQDYSKPR